MTTAVPGTVEALILDLLDWLAAGDRSYEETIDAWRTSCPRLPVWEDATDLGLVRVERRTDGASVRVTAAGVQFLRSRRHAPIVQLDRQP